jgi:peptidyl-prolyl cis-trans isomerase C
MVLIFTLILALPQDYVNLIMDGKYQEAIEYCQDMIQKNKDPYQWKLEMGDIHYNKLLNLDEAAGIYQDVVDNYKHKNGWAYYRLAQIQEMREDFLNSARMYEIVATRFRKAPLDSFSLTGVERCFKKNYQDYVATVDGYNITRLELDERIGRGGPLGGSDEHAVLDQMITERLIHTSAIKHDVMATAFFQDNYKIRNKTLLLDEVRKVEIMQKAEPTEKQMKKYYKDHKDDYKIPEQAVGKEIIVESDSLAQALLDSLKKDIASFDTLAKLYSSGPSARNGGNMGVVYRNRRPEVIEAAIFGTEPNNLTGIVAFDNKYGIYYITSYKPEQYHEFEEVKKQTEAQVRNENIIKEEEAFIKRLRKKAKLQIYEDSIIKVAKDTTGQTGDVVVARINGRNIVWTDVLHGSEAMSPQFDKTELTRPDGVEQLIDNICEEELKLELAWREKYFLYDGYFVQLKDAMNAIMDQALYQKIVLDQIAIDSQEVVKYYEEHMEEFMAMESARISEIVLDSKKAAEEVHKLVKADPEAFDSLAVEHSTGQVGIRGGHSGYIRRGMIGGEYDNVVFALKDGEISDVFNVRDSLWTIVKMVDYTPEGYRPLDEVRSLIESRLRREQQMKLAQDFLTKIKEEADISIFLPEPEEPEKEPAPEEESKD